MNSISVTAWARSFHATTLGITPMNSQCLSFRARAESRASFHLPTTAVARYNSNRTLI